MGKYLNVVALALFTAPMLAQHSDWQIRTMDNRVLSQVSLVGLEDDSLLLHSPEFDGKIDVASIARIERGKTNVIPGITAGLIAGAAIGYFIGSKEQDNSFTNSSFSYDSDKRVSNLFIGGAIGGALGGLIGSLSGTDITRLEGRNNEEKLASLRAILTREVVHKSENTKQQDAVYLKTGSIIRGRVLEIIPDSTVRILTADSSLFVFNMSDVVRIANIARPAEIPSQRRPSTVASISPVSRSWSFGINIGPGLPVGSFGAASGSTPGLAKIGFAGGADGGYRISPTVDILASFFFSSHGVDEGAFGLPSSANAESGSWKLFWPMIGMRVTTPNTDALAMFGIGQIGLLAGSSPELSANFQGTGASQPSSSASSVAFSVGAGVISNQRVTFSLRYFYGKPEYDLTASAGPYVISARANQPTSLIFIGLGVVF